MAFAFDGFSIREYTSKMRSVDVLKCWPFSITNSSDVSREDLKSCLPPMTVPKFRLQPDELEAVRSDHDDRRKSEQQLPDGEISRSGSESLKSEKSVGAEEDRLVCPVCRVFNAATLTAVNAHIDGCLAQTMREERRQMKITSLKPKSKAPKKKRSIAEIFEVEVEQPRMETLFKIWPFNKNPDEVSITVTKLRWWSRQLEALRSNQEGESSRNENESAKSDDGRGREEEKLEMVCPVSGAFNASTVTAVKANIDVQALTEERRHMRLNFKPKPKAPKKRSIAEILAVAPQIEAKCSDLIEIDEEGEEEGKSDVGGGDDDDSSKPAAAATAVFSTIHSKRNKNKNKKKKKMERRWKKKLKKKRKVENHSGGTVTLNNDKEPLNRNKKKKKKLLHNGLNAKKEDTYKREGQTPAKSFSKLKGTIGNKRAALDDINASAHKKKASLKHAPVGKKQEAMENYSTHIFGKASSGCNVQDGIEDKTCNVQEQILATHVAFSNEDNMLGPKERSSSDERMFSSDGQAASSVKEQSSATDETACLEVNRRDGSITFNMDRRKEVGPVVESKQFSTTPERVPPKGFLRSCATSDKKKHLVEKTESMTEMVSDDNDYLHLFDRGNTTALHSSAQSSIPRSLSSYQEDGISGSNTRVGDSGAYSFPGKFMDHRGDSTHQVSATDSDASTRTFMQSSPLHHTLYNQGSEKPLFPSQNYGDNSQTLGYRPLPQMFSANSSMDEKFFGLPLNSQGDLINFSSCAKGGVNQPETSSMLRSSSSRLLFDNIAYRSSHEYLSTNESHFVPKTLSQDSVNKFPHYPARLGVTNQLQGSGGADMHQFNTYRGSNQFVSALDSELKPMKYPFVEQNQHDQVQNHKRNEIIHLKKGSDLSSKSSTQPTMRLMGKDVPIGRSIKEEDVWAEQQSRSHPYRDAALENSSLETCSKQDHLRGSPLQSTALMNGPEFEFPQPFLDLQTNHVPQIVNQGFSKTASCYSHPITYAHTLGSASNRAPQDSPEQSVAGPRFQGLGSHLQSQLATCNYNQHACQSNGDLYARKELPLVTRPAFGFPLVHPAFGEHAKASWFQSYNRSLPPCLLTHERLPGNYSQQISGPSSISFPHTEWGGRFPTPVNHSVLNCSLVNYCHMKTPISPASVVEPPLFPRKPAIKPSLTIRSGCRNKRMVNDRVILEDQTTDDLDLCNNTRKRPAANLHGSTKLIKLNDIGVPENLNGVSGLIQENSSCEFRRTARTVEVAPQGDSSRSKCCCLNEAQNMMSKSYLGLQISGPGRPSPGTRHVLEPSPNVAATTDTNSDLDSQRKLTKIYEF